MRKFLVRLLNLVYVAAAGVALYALCTKPMLDATVTLKFNKEQMGSLLSGVLNKNSESSEEEGEEGETRLVYREEHNIRDYVTKEKLQEYFSNGYTVTIPLQIPITGAFNLKNTHLLDDLIQNNLHTIVDNVVESVIDPLHNMFKDVFKGYALDTLSDQINKQIQEKFPGSANATDEEINAVFDSVYSLLDTDEPVTVDTLAETILHGSDDGEGGTTGGVLNIINSRGRKYVLYDPQPTEEEVEADRTAEAGSEKYFVSYLTYSHNTAAYNSENAYFQKISENSYELFDPQPTEEQVEADRTAEESAWTYYVAKTAYKHNTEPYNSATQYYEAQPYTDSDVDEQKITDEVIKALEDADGLVTKVPRLCEPQPTEEQVTADIAIENEKDRVYYILDANNEPVLPTAYDPNATYYFVDKVVNDIDTAVNALISQFLGTGENSGDSRAIYREEEPHESSSSSKDSLKETIRDYFYKMIPENISEKSGALGEKAPYILLAVLALFALPWAWFIIVTLIRTFRKHKCWTRLGIIIWGALLQVILGVVLTYGTKFGWSLLASRIEALKQYADGINFNIQTGALIPSFIWLGIAITAIPYWIIRKPLKNRQRLIETHERRAAMLRKRERWINSEEH